MSRRVGDLRRAEGGRPRASVALAAPAESPVFTPPAPLPAEIATPPAPATAPAAAPSRAPEAAAPPPPPAETPSDALRLVVVERTLRGGDEATAAILSVAEALARGGEIVLVDLDAQHPALAERLGAVGAEGLADALLFGASLRQSIARSGEEGGVSVLPLGRTPDPDALLAHAGWKRLVREAERRELTLVAHVAQDAPGLAALAARAGGAVLVVRAGDEASLRAALPATLRVDRVITLPAARPTSRRNDDPVELAQARASIATALGGAVASETGAPPAEAPAPPSPEAPPAEEAAARGFGATLLSWLRTEEERLTGGATETAPETSTEKASERPATPPRDQRRGAERDWLAMLTPSVDDLPGEVEADEPFARVVALPRPSGRPPAKYIVPRIAEWREKLTRVAAVLILAYWTYYIVWRWTATLNYDALWFSLPLVLAETWGLLTAFFLVFTTWRLNHRTPLPAPPELSVDVFITTYDEPLEIIRRTAISARAIHYPHRTYVLDDGRRDEVRAMAEEFGIEYIRRENNEHAKAGNLNHALARTSGDFILQLDADHAPLPQILHQTLGFFGDDRVGFVQTPQDFYNTDSFTSDLNEAGHRLWEEQRLFFAVIQPGKDCSNSAFFCGSCAVVRRAALDEIGGFSTESITEDIETSLLLHARGWKSVYYGESLAYGLAAGSADAFHTQHRRWARGAMQVIRKFNPIWYPGLSGAQRVGYFYSLTAYVIGLQKLIFYSAPIVFFLTGVLPISTLDREFMLRFVPYLVLSVSLAELLARGLGFTWLVERYQMAKFWTYAKALPTYFTSRRLPFRVTPKGPGRVPLATYLPQLLLMTATVIAVNWATLAVSYGWVDYHAPGWRSLAFQVNFLWALLNFILAAYVVRLSIRIQQQRQDHRFSDRFPMHVRLRGPRGHLGERDIALTEDLNAAGLRFRSVKHFEPGSELKLTLPLSTGEASVNAAVVHVHRDPESELPIYIHGVEFLDVPFDVRDAIELHCAHHAVPIDQMSYQGQTGVMIRAQEWVRNARGEPRRRVRLPTVVQIGAPGDGAEAREAVACLEEISRTGARLIMDQAVPPGTPMIFEVPGTQLRGQGRAVFSRALETPIGVRFAVGMRREIGRDQDSRSDKKMRIPRLWRAAGVATSLVLALGGLARPLAAQLETAVFGAGETDTQKLSVVLLGVSVQPAGLGWKPTGTVLAYQLTFPNGSATQKVTGVNPQAGMRYQWPVGAVQATVGYLFLSNKDVGGFGVQGGGKAGVTASAMADYWGTGPRTAQAIASYNFADGYVWSRARAAHQVMELSGSPLRLGAEVVGQGGGLGKTRAAGAPTAFRSFQVGGLAQYQMSPTFQLVGVVGGKSDNIAGNPSLFPYLKLEFVLLP